MTDRVMSPTAAQAHARRAMRKRFKLARYGRRVDPPNVFADRLVTYAEATAEAFPVEPSAAYCEYVHEVFSARFLELCRVAPVAVRRDA